MKKYLNNSSYNLQGIGYKPIKCIRSIITYTLQIWTANNDDDVDNGNNDDDDDDDINDENDLMTTMLMITEEILAGTAKLATMTLY